jgi:type II secretory pathway pseudopilin PulG
MKELNIMKKNERGLSLIDLMISVAVISILGSMIVTQIAVFAVRTENATAVSDLRLAAQSQETLKATYGGYGRSEMAQLPGGGIGAGVVLVGPGNPEYPNILTMMDAEYNVHGILLQLSSGVGFIAKNDIYGTTYTMAVKHGLGNTVFALDADSKAIYMDKTSAPVGMQLVGMECLNPTAGINDFLMVQNWNPL